MNDAAPFYHRVPRSVNEKAGTVLRGRRFAQVHADQSLIIALHQLYSVSYTNIFPSVFTSSALRTSRFLCRFRSRVPLVFASSFLPFERSLDVTVLLLTMKSSVSLR